MRTPVFTASSYLDKVSSLYPVSFSCIFSSVCSFILHHLNFFNQRMEYYVLLFFLTSLYTFRCHNGFNRALISCFQSFAHIHCFTAVTVIGTEQYSVINSRTHEDGRQSKPGCTVTLTTFRSLYKLIGCVHLFLKNTSVSVCIIVTCFFVSLLFLPA